MKPAVLKRLVKVVRPTKPIRLVREANPADKKSRIVASAKFGSGCFINLQILYLFLGGGKVINLVQVNKPSTSKQQ